MYDFPPKAAMKRKTEQARQFMESLHKTITTDPRLPKKIKDRSEKEIQKDVYYITLDYLVSYFRASGLDDEKSKTKAREALYWEGQDGHSKKERPVVFGARNYPDLLIREPYLVAIEYAQSDSGSVVKRGMGQSIMHTLCGEYDFVYYLFHDKSDDLRIRKSIHGVIEKEIKDRAWEDFNVFMGFVVEDAS